jgi:beta-xylosidase
MGRGSGPDSADEITVDAVTATLAPFIFEEIKQKSLNSLHYHENVISLFLSTERLAMKKIIYVFLAILIFLSPGLFAQGRGLSLLVKDLGPNTRAGRQYLLLVAIDKYKSWPPLKNPVNDAREIKEILTSRYFIDETIELYDESATKANIIKTFESLQSRLQVNDSLLVVYAGHGHIDKTTNSGFWIPVNAGTDKYEQANWLPNTQIRGLISNIKAIHLLIVSDSCFSGDLLNSSRGLPDEINIEYFKRSYNRISRQILTSGASETVPDESEFARMFKMALLKNNSTYYDPLMLFNEIRLGVRGSMPMFGNLKDTGHQEGASFLLFLKEETPKEAANIEEPVKVEPKKVEKKNEVVAKAETKKDATTATARDVIFSDEFDGPGLDQRWSWVRQTAAGWSLKSTPGFLTITAANGDLFRSKNDCRNLLFTETGASDFSLETRLDFSPWENFHQAGLIVYQDDDNYVRLSVVYTEERKIEILNEVKGEPVYVNASFLRSPVTLRLVKQGNTYTGYYSPDGINFKLLDTVSNNLGSTPKAGLAAFNNSALTSAPARFDYFRLAKVPAVSELFFDGFDKLALDKRWHWVRENPSDWSLGTRPGSLAILGGNGDLWEKRNDNRNILLTDVKAGDFTIETKVDIITVENFQLAGVIIYVNDDNYVRVSVTHNERRHVEIVNEVRGVFTYTKIPFAGNPAFLRLEKHGDTFFGYASEDGKNFTVISKMVNSLSGQLKIGLISNNTEANSRVTAYFDYCRLFVP